MLNIILKIESSYIIWSKKNNAPLTHIMTKESLIRWIEDNERQDGEDSIVARLERVDRTGCSSAYDSFKDLIDNNQAGYNNEHLSLEEIKKEYGIHAPHNKRFKLNNEEDLHITEEVDNNVYSINSFWQISNKAILFMAIIVFICVAIQIIDKVYYPLNNLGMISLIIEMYIIGLLSSSKMKIWKKRP